MLVIFFKPSYIFLTAPSKPFRNKIVFFVFFSGPDVLGYIFTVLAFDCEQFLFLHFRGLSHNLKERNVKIFVGFH